MLFCVPWGHWFFISFVLHPSRPDDGLPVLTLEHKILGGLARSRLVRKKYIEGLPKELLQRKGLANLVYHKCFSKLVGEQEYSKFH
ncbi:hypothetical protein CEXT_185521 [Caerostris extrusa]|uniref:Uncharacterized protein n=1 Tax=Caerostris extrusa TaxID=172846 RepID=A0AAV4SEW6_CAEEX|nr:hypothetical protein CEXT_185521 [Caerostris extrusa]